MFVFLTLHISIIVFVMSKHVEHCGGTFGSLELDEIHLETRQLGSAHVASAKKNNCTTIPETNSWHLNMECWNTIVTFWESAHFQVGSVSCSECIRKYMHQVFVEKHHFAGVQVVKILFRMDFRIFLQSRCGCIA